MTYNQKERLTRIKNEGGDGAVVLVKALVESFKVGLAMDSSDKDAANDRVASAYAQLVREGSVGLTLENMAYYPTYHGQDGAIVPVRYQKETGVADEMYEYMQFFHKQRLSRQQYVDGLRAILENVAQKLSM